MIHGVMSIKEEIKGCNREAPSGYGRYRRNSPGNDQDEDTDRRCRRIRGKRRGKVRKSFRKIADKYNVPTNKSPRAEEREWPVAESNVVNKEIEQQRLRWLDKIENVKRARERLREERNDWEQDSSRRERRSLDESDSDYTQRELDNLLDKKAALKEELRDLNVRLERHRQNEEDQIEGYRDWAESMRKELIRVKTKRDEIAKECFLLLEEKQERKAEMKTIEEELALCEEAVHECQEDIDLINQYDEDLSCKSLDELKALKPLLDRDIDILLEQTRNAQKEDRDCDITQEKLREKLDLCSDDIADLRRKEGRIISKSRTLLKELNRAFHPLRYADLAQEEGYTRGRRSVSGFFSRSQDRAPMSNDKISHCRGSILKIETVMQNIPGELHRGDSETEDDFNRHFRSLLIHLLNKVGGCIMKFNEMLLRGNDMGKKHMYLWVDKMETNMETANEIETVKNNTHRNEYSRTLKRLEALTKQIKKLKDERLFRNKALTKFRQDQRRYREEYRCQYAKLRDIQDNEKENERLQGEVEILKDHLGQLTSNVSRRKTHIKRSEELVWNTLRSIGDERRGAFRKRKPYKSKKERECESDCESDSEFCEKALREISSWDDNEVANRRSQNRERTRYCTEAQENYDTPRGPDTPRSYHSSSRSREGPTPGYWEDYEENKSDEFSPVKDTAREYNDAHSFSREYVPQREIVPPDLCTTSDSESVESRNIPSETSSSGGRETTRRTRGDSL